MNKEKVFIMIVDQDFWENGNYIFTRWAVKNKRAVCMQSSNEDIVSSGTVSPWDKCIVNISFSCGNNAIFHSYVPESKIDPEILAKLQAGLKK